MTAVMMAGRETKRVPLDFDWPLNETWQGYVSPSFPKCPACDGQGTSREARAVHDAFYAFDAPDEIAWVDKLGQLEVDNLWRKGRLRSWDADSRRWETGDAPPAAASVNEANRRGAAGMGGHDGINRWILVRFRCERLGITLECPQCDGHGYLASPEQRQTYNDWTATEPPEGDGWQLWETVSEGSPQSPVFDTLEALCAWCAVHAKVAGHRYTAGGWARLLGGEKLGFDIHNGDLV